MLQIDLHRHPLKDALTEERPVRGVNHLSIARRPVIVAALAQSTEAFAGLQALHGEGFSLCHSSPEIVLLVSRSARFEDVSEKLAAFEGLDLVDQSDAHVLIALSGPDARRLLAKAVPLDLHPQAFPVGHSARSLCGQVCVQLIRTALDVFELLVPTSYAEFLLEEMRQMGREFAFTADVDPETP